ncbi:hypothetical protein Pan181_23630 [Aeoliella mucimassa]|uniref:DNA-binding protein n=2 Tax=Aeoliella mucimassa TaxID=2527972 RepID=A0A518AN49_9BACT|nr:hypothetical protein Pan181_23630 [Aeoliella mucimassa]
MPSKPPKTLPNTENWVRLTDMANMIGVGEQKARNIHEEMGRPFEKIVQTRGKPVLVDSVRWLQAWRWYYLSKRR